MLGAQAAAKLTRRKKWVMGVFCINTLANLFFLPRGSSRCFSDFPELLPCAQAQAPTCERWFRPNGTTSCSGSAENRDRKSDPSWWMPYCCSFLTLLSCQLWRGLKWELSSSCDCRISAFLTWLGERQVAAAQFCHFCLWVVAFPSQHFYLSRLDNALWFFSFYFWLAHLGWIVSRLAVLAACQHKPANLVQNLIISLLFSTRLNSTTVQVCQKCCSVSVSSVHRGMDLSDWRIPLPPFCSFFVHVCAHVREGQEEGTAALRDKHPFLSLSWKPI